MVPTMLIGIGGIGSRYVDALYGRLSEEQRDRVAIHAIDTDINSISGLQHIGQDRCSQIGAKGTVGDYLSELKQSGAATTVERWFPRRYERIKRSRMVLARYAQWHD
ncbi:hypothetical protein [Vibrio metschnikovii]|uniref:hypothetical protein n=1 Tax=Vibrio metschnikovii TaxID=28172 RepID=UPI001C2F6002|nr:hypothetical protein [Vibrio metschnikovii]